MSTATTSSTFTWPLTVLFDGSRPGSKEDLEHLKSKDKTGNLKLVDISQSGFKASDYGLADDEAKKSIHARDASGKVLEGSAALEAAHEAVGLGHYYRFTRAPGLTGSGSGFRR